MQSDNPRSENYRAETHDSQRSNYEFTDGQEGRNTHTTVSGTLNVFMITDKGVEFSTEKVLADFVLKTVGWNVSMGLEIHIPFRLKQLDCKFENFGN